MSLRKQFATNADKEQKGVPFKPGVVNEDGTEPTFYLARASQSNPAYVKVQDRIMAPHRAALARRLLPEAKFDELTRQVFAEGAILGWDNVLWEDVAAPDDKDTPRGGHAEYSKERAVQLLKNVPELYEMLVQAADDRTRYQDTEADAKN